LKKGFQVLKCLSIYIDTLDILDTLALGTPSSIDV
jgi:hypothetical protein